MRLFLIAMLLANAMLLTILLSEGERESSDERPPIQGTLRALTQEQEREARAAAAKAPGCVRFGPFEGEVAEEGMRLAEAEWPGKRKKWAPRDEGSSSAWILVDAKAKRKGSGGKESFGALVKACSEKDRESLWKEEPPQ